MLNALELRALPLHNYVYMYLSIIISPLHPGLGKYNPVSNLLHEGHAAQPEQTVYMYILAVLRRIPG